MLLPQELSSFQKIAVLELCAVQITMASRNFSVSSEHLENLEVIVLIFIRNLEY